MIGGVAVIARGVARFTADIDVTVAAADLDVATLLRALGRERIKPRIADWQDLLQRAQVLLLVHEPTGIDVDLSMAWLPFESDAIANAELVRFGGTPIRAVTPTALVIYKLIAHRPQDLMDVERLLAIHDIDSRQVNRVLTELADHLDGPDRLATFQSLRREVAAAMPGPRRQQEGRRRVGSKPASTKRRTRRKPSR